MIFTFKTLPYIIWNVTIFVDGRFQTNNQHIFVNSEVNMGTKKNVSDKSLSH
jgi:hypothetical protein